MKKYLIFIIPLFIWGCSKTYNDVIDPGNTNYQVTNVTSFADTSYHTGDSAFTFSISLNTSSGINSVFMNLFDPDNNQLNSDPVILFDDGKAIHGDLTANDNTYSNKYPFSQSFVNGKYSVKYYVVDINGPTLAAVHNFNYNNNQADFPPVVSDLVAPDTVSLGTDTIKIFLTIKVSDANGLNDISLVFFNSFLPNGNPSSQNPFDMRDNGDPFYGDAVAGDGIYSKIIGLPPTGVTKGTYRFEFQARDREGILSNKIIHNVVIK
jgi:hypothetical protein